MELQAVFTGQFVEYCFGFESHLGLRFGQYTLYIPYICMYMYVYLYVYVGIYICICMYISVYVCVCMYIWCIWLCISGGVNPLLIFFGNVCSLCPQLYRRVNSGESCGVLRAISWPVIDLACVYE